MKNRTFSETLPSSDNNTWIWIILGALLLLGTLTAIGALTLINSMQPTEAPTGNQSVPTR